MGAGKTITGGTDKSVPYKVRSKTQQRTCVTQSDTVSSIVSTPGDLKIQQRTIGLRGTHGFARTLDTGQPEINVSVGASMRR